MKHHRVSYLAIALVPALALSACAGSNNDAGQSSNPVCVGTQSLPVSTVGIRLYLTDAVLQRLQARAAANDAAWTALKTRCDGLAGGTFNKPSGDAYPAFPAVGQGYQGDGYLPEIMNLGLCYRVLETKDATTAAKYAAAGGKLLEAMATPAGSGGQSPGTDSGYGIRNYGVGMATGYDWLKSGLSSSTKQAVITALNTWIDFYDSKGFSNNAPVGNYFAGYLLAKTLTAIATDGDNSNASKYWDDVQKRMWGQLVKPAYANMAGGGWPEGWQYGPLSVREMVQFLWAVRTGKQLDWWAELPQARDQAAYIRNFAWPSLRHMDDQGTVHSQQRLAPPTATSMAIAAMLEWSGDTTNASIARQFAADLLAANGSDADPWQQFLFWDDSLPKASYANQPASYFAAGPGHVAVRSRWSKDAVWGTFVSGQYIDAPDSGEQYFNQGAVAIVQGDTPVIVNGTGWLPQAGGDNGENFVYDDTWGNRARLLNNTYYVAGSTQDGPTQNMSQTHMERFEDQGVFVRARGAGLAAMYLSNVVQWTRDFVYVRPGTFVVYDRTTAEKAADQWLSWHTAVQPKSATAADSSQVRYDIGTAGSVRTLLPKSATPKTTSLVNGAAYRLEMHAPTTGTTQDWLTVITTGGTTPEQVRLSQGDGNVSAGNVVGVHVQSARNTVVLFNTDHAGSATTASAKYVVAQTGDADHMLFDMTPSSTGYAVTATVANGKISVNVAQGGPFKLTGQGTLAFVVHANGAIDNEPLPPSTGGDGGTGGSSGGGSGSGSSSGGGSGSGSSSGGGSGSSSGGSPSSCN